MNFERFGKYILLEKLATGGMAEIYLAKTTGAQGVNKFVGIKRILPQFSQNADFIQMFQEEAKVSINLNHSNVVSILDFGFESSQFYIVMEYVSGKNLRQLINELKKQNKSLKIEEAVYIIKEAAAGLDHAHRCTDQKTGRPLNITHRDMSPQNIMISYEGETKVIDFGIAKQNESDREETRAGTLKGKFAYMSPEQAEGESVDPRTDIFALGIILWELLANDRLFTGSNESVILRKVRDCIIQPIRKINPLVPPDLERILHKALAKEKNNRYQTAVNFQKELSRFLNTHYPDFSPQDLSKRMVETFSSSYTEAKEHFKEYARIEILPDPVKEESKVDKNNNDNAQFSPPPTLPEFDESNEVLTKLTASATEKVELTGLKEAKRELNKTIYKNSNLTHIKHNQQPLNNKKNTKPSSSYIEVILFAALVFGGIWAYQNNYIPENLIKNITLVLTQDKTKVVKPAEPLPQGDVELAAKASVNLSVRSNPPGAQIYVDDENTLRTTPAIVSVPLNKPVKIRLMKDNYYDYVNEQTYSTTQSLDFTLQEKAKAGYLNIVVQNGGLNPVVTINGIRLDEKPPISRYSVAANTDIKIEVENPITKAHGAKTIRVQPNKEENVEIILSSPTH